MGKFLWDETYSVGNIQMDAEHKKILSIINLLADHPEATERSETVSDILGQLTKYAYQHFEHEEQLLEEHGYQDLPAQRKEHQEFRRRIAEFCSNVMNERPEIREAPEDLLKYLRIWWGEHILVSDMKYRPYLEPRLRT